MSATATLASFPSTQRGAASYCAKYVTKANGDWDVSETQFKFRGVIQEEKPLRDWLQEVLMNSLGYYTFAFGKLKVGVRVNSSAVEAFTEGKILFSSLQLAPARPSFNQLRRRGLRVRRQLDFALRH